MTTATAPVIRAGTPTAASPTGPAVLLVLGSCVSLQFGAALAAHLFPVAGTAGATFVRLGLAAVILLAIVRPKAHRWTGRQWSRVLLFGLTLAGMNGFFYASIARIPLGTAVTIEFLGPLTVAAVLSRQVRQIGWVLLAGIGVVGLGWAGGGSVTGLDHLGLFYAFIAAVFWALYILANARAGAAVPGQGGLAVAMATGSLAILPFGVHGAAHLLTRPHLMPIALGTALLASVIPYTLELAALRRLSRNVFGVLLSLEPAIATAAGWLLLAQHVGLTAAIAIGVVILASVGSTLSAH